MYTPWPFSDLFEELGDKVEVRDYGKYNFVTPIMKPDGMTRSEVLHGVMNNYKRFYMRKSFLSYPWIRDSFKRRYMLGCLKAFMKSTFERRFYDLGRIGYRRGEEVDFKFDPDKVLKHGDALVKLRTRAPAPPAIACSGDATAGHTAPRGGSVDAIDPFFDPRGHARAQRARPGAR